MANSINEAKSAYGKAISGLNSACVLLLQHIPLDNAEVEILLKPSLWPSLGDKNRPILTQCTAECPVLVDGEMGQQSKLQRKGRVFSCLHLWLDVIRLHMVLILRV